MNLNIRVVTDIGEWDAGGALHPEYSVYTEEGVVQRPFSRRNYHGKDDDLQEV